MIESEDHKNGLEKGRKDFKNVAIKLPVFTIDSCYKYRPYIDQVEKLNKLSDEIRNTPNAVVNFLVNVGLEVLERSVPKLKEELEKEINKKITKLIK